MGGQVGRRLASDPVDILHVHSPYVAGFARIVVRLLLAELDRAWCTRSISVVRLRRTHPVVEPPDVRAERRNDPGLGRRLGRPAPESTRTHARDRPWRPPRAIGGSAPTAMRCAGNWASDPTRS